MALNPNATFPDELTRNDTIGFLVCIRNDEFHIEDDGFCIKTDDFCIENDELTLKMMNSLLKTDDFLLKNVDFMNKIEEGGNALSTVLDRLRLRQAPPSAPVPGHVAGGGARARGHRAGSEPLHPQRHDLRARTHRVGLGSRGSRGLQPAGYRAARSVNEARILRRCRVLGPPAGIGAGGEGSDFDSN